MRFDYSISLLKQITKTAMQNYSENIDSSSQHASVFSGTLSEQRLIDSSLLEGFNEAQNYLAEFIQTLPDKGENPIGDMIFNFCGKYQNLQISPKNVAHLLEKRIQRMLKNRKKKKNWNSQDSKLILWFVSKYMQREEISFIQSMTQKDWEIITKLIPGTTYQDCMFKILSLKKTRLSDKKWTSKESQILSQIAIKHKKRNWKRISEKLYLRNEEQSKIFRNAKQCKEHWTCYLNPDLKKGSWDNQEDRAMLEYILKNQGKKKWSDLTKVVKGRTENAIKNRYNLILERQSQHLSSRSQLQVIEKYLKKLDSDAKNSEVYKKILFEGNEMTQKMEKNMSNEQQKSQNQANFQTIAIPHLTYVMPTSQQTQGQFFYPIIPQNNLFFFVPSKSNSL